MQLGTAGNESSIDDLFEILTDGRRRTALSVMSGRESPMDVEALARAVAARESDVAPASVSDPVLEAVHITLHHVHLPKLDDVSLVDYDRDEKTVAATSTADAIPIDIE